MNDYEMFELDQEDHDELYEDINNIYLKYFDRYIARENHTIRVKGSVIIAIMNTTDNLNKILLTSELDKLIRKLGNQG